MPVPSQAFTSGLALGGGKNRTSCGRNVMQLASLAPLKRVWATLILAGVLAGVAHAQEARLVGQVREATGETEGGGATVMIFNSHELLADRTVTDTKGQFYFMGLAPDEYTVVVSKPGYYPVEARVNVSTMIREQYVTVFITPEAVLPGVKGAQQVSAAELALPGKTRRELERGKAALRKQKYPAAISHLKAVTEAEPRFALGFEVLGVAYLRARNSLDAETAFNQALVLDPKRSESFFQLGLLNYQRKRLDESEKYLAQGLALDPRSLFGHYQRGLTLLALEKYAGSAEEFQQALELNPSFSEAHVRLGNVYLRQQNPSRALAEFERYLQTAPKGQFAPRVREVVREMRASGITPLPSQPTH